ncbi:MAG: hypothetical protein EOO41_02395 [Methanobacteriota archaeon]|nr:MAG: hypothetical protein EOO41_02395 [Euryarchaeota archaeon]
MCSLVDDAPLPPRVQLRPLILGVKLWTKVKELSDASKAYLASYSYLLMVLFYCQLLHIVPSLQSPEVRDDSISRCVTALVQPMRARRVQVHTVAVPRACRAAVACAGRGARVWRCVAQAGLAARGIKQPRDGLGQHTGGCR